MIVNQKFIAEKAGVSQKTVSLFFQNDPRIAAKTRAKIDDILKKYDYLPNMAARSIKTKRFNRIACVVIQYGERTALPHPQFMAYLNGAALEFAQSGYSLVFEPVFVPSVKNIYYHDFFSTLSVDGILGLPGGWVPKNVIDHIRKLALPTVWLNQEPKVPDQECILIDEEKTTRLLAEHIMKQGARRVVWFGPEYRVGESVHYSSGVRFLTLKAYLEEHGGVLVQAAFALYGYSLDSCAEKLLDEKENCDIFVAYNYNYKVALSNACIKKKIGQWKIAIAHFASMWEFSGPWSSGSAVVLPEVELGGRGAKYLLSCLNGTPEAEYLKPLAGYISEDNEQNNRMKMGEKI